MYEAFLKEDQIENEFLLWKRQWHCPTQSKSVNSAILALQHCSPVTLPNINVLLRILATLPVTTAQPERVFSKVEKTASAARASMTEDRLEALVLLQTHRDKTPSIDAVIDSFAANTTSSSRRFVL
jgi:hAT family C-terminal dimerisation region